LELPGRKEQYEGLMKFAISAAAQAMLSQLYTASRLAVESAAMCTDRKSAELLGQQLSVLLSGLARGDYSDCWQAKSCEEEAHSDCWQAKSCEEDATAYRSGKGQDKNASS
jgi:hypothetical protein